jgi:hypothetical protein
MSGVMVVGERGRCGRKRGIHYGWMEVGEMACLMVSVMGRRL